MEVEFGFTHSDRPLNVHVDMDADSLTDLLNKALASQSPATVTTSDKKVILINTQALAYAMIGGEEKRSVGFGFHID